MHLDSHLDARANSAVDDYIEQNRSRILNELQEYLRIPSVSTLPAHKSDVLNAAEFVAEKLRAAGLDNVRKIPTKGHPLIYGEWLRAPGKPTVLCYGHYDVQPPDPLNEWITPPFEPSVRGEDIFARGAADDKGQMYVHIKAAEAMLALNQKLPVNVKFLIEGEEEIGGESVDEYVKHHATELACDVALVSDTHMFAPGLPTLCVGLRGLVYTELFAKGARVDLHSGLYGGAAPNPLMGLAQIISRLVNAEGEVQIPAFYDDVLPPAPDEIASWSRLPFSESEFLSNEVGSARLVGDERFSVLERIWSRPTLEIHGITGGFQGEGAKTVIPACASAKVSMRLVPNQHPEKILEAFKREIARVTPAGLQVDVKVHSCGEPLLMDRSHPFVAAAAQALTEVFGRETVFTRGGGSIPIVARMQQSLKAPVVLMGLGLPDDRLHSPNEKFHLPNFYNGIRAVARFWEKLSSHAGIRRDQN
jgi:acetylornithine deacetylase/succinyl-diaminopimelate desuccinylase-like protein